MNNAPCPACLAAILLLGAVGVVGCTPPPAEPNAADAARQSSQRSPTAAAEPRARPDLTEGKRTGEASFYAEKFTGRMMADGSEISLGAISSPRT